VKPAPMPDHASLEVEPEHTPDSVSFKAGACSNNANKHFLDNRVDHQQQVPAYNMTLLRRVQGVLHQAQKTSMTAEALHQRLVAVCSQDKSVPEVLALGASSDDALCEVGKESGVCNWMLIDADGFGLHGAGHGGIEEMTSHLADDKVMFGVLRLSFSVSSQQLKKAAQGFSAFLASDGSNRSKYIAYVFLHWVGPAVSAVRRGLFNAKRQKAVAMAKKHCSLAVQWRANSIEDVSIDAIVSDLRNIKALGAADCSGLQGGISVTEYFRFLHEEEVMP